MRRLSILSSTSPNTRTAYSRSTSCEGCIRRLASSPSLVNNNKPLVLISNRPTAIQRPFLIAGNRSNTVARPSGSLRLHSSPSGLLYINTRQAGVSLGVLRALPSTRILSAGSTLSPKVASFPLTEIRPASIHLSISRREPTPALASTFCNLSLINVIALVRLEALAF